MLFSATPPDPAVGEAGSMRYPPSSTEGSVADCDQPSLAKHAPP